MNRFLTESFGAIVSTMVVGKVWIVVNESSSIQILSATF